ncbi:YgfZ/GcvT domain-containing protein [Actibacterium ureilyticum]|uniref:CAF17-like 4Fe-4S cluster assembly/insertion protein YgfZ n=1 Tax=Actibacterium ureilyticum TaxID=1590614 RepID=UPI000BAACEAA|nr:folate-binding protein YgfZ [Actibacterium ureilyticum]
MSADRTLIQITGSDARDFLQNLITNDLSGIDGGLVYAALLTPQGKYLADFFLTARDGGIVLDVATALAPGLVQRLNMYKLRADVQLSQSTLHVSRGTGPAPDGALPDPRHPDMGWRLYSDTALPDDGTDWDALRVAHCIPETGVELIPNDSFILEAGFERLHGVDFKKGCYVGQEVTARMKHKTELRKGLVTVDITGTAPVGAEITAAGKAAGTLYTQAQGRAIAYLRFDRATGPMTAGDATLTWHG